MTSKKSKVVKKSTKSITTKKEIKKPDIVNEPVQTLYPAYKIAQMFNIPDFDFYIVKRKYDFDNGTLFTISEFKKMYKQAILEGR